MSRMRSTDVSTTSTGASTSTREPIEKGDFVSFIEYSLSPTGRGLDKMTASGYVIDVSQSGDVVIEFNDHRHTVQEHACRIICKQYKLPGF